MNIIPYIIAFVLLTVGYIPVQAARTRRAAVIAGIVGLLIIPVALLVLRTSAITLNNLLVGVIIIWVAIVGYGVFTGAIMRYVILGRPPMSARDRWALVLAGLAVFALVGWFTVTQVIGSK